MTSLLVLDPKALENQIVSLLRKRSERRYTSQEILDILAEKKLLKRSKRVLVLEALSRISSKGVQRKRAICRALNERSEVVYYYQKSSYKTTACYLCGEANHGWALLGGLYEGHLSLNSMCESLPQAICETCYRVNFCGVRRSDVVATGIAVLPCVTATATRGGFALQDPGTDIESKEECAPSIANLSHACNALESLAAGEMELAQGYSDMFNSFSEIDFEGDLIGLQRAFFLSSVFACYEYRDASEHTSEAAFYLSSFGDLVEEGTCVDASASASASARKELLDVLISILSCRIQLSQKLVSVWTNFFSHLETDETAVIQACKNIALTAVSNDDALTSQGAHKRLDCSLSSRSLSRGTVCEEWALGHVTTGEYQGSRVKLYITSSTILCRNSWDILNNECKKLIDLEDNKYLAKFLGTIRAEGSIEFVWRDDAEYVPLHDFLKDPLNVHRVSGAEIPLALQICSALEELHSHKPPIVHGNLSSSTVFISQDCHIKLGNYGINNVFQGCYSLSKVVCWVAPEIILSKADTAFSKDSDLFAYGMVIWYLYSRRAPYKNMHSAEALYSIALDGLRPDMKDLPMTLAGLVNWCLDVDPSARPRLDEIEAYLQDALPR